MNNVIPVSSTRFPAWKKCRILNAWVDDLTVEQVVDRLDEGILWTLNPDHLYHLQRNADFVEAYRQAAIVSSDSKYVFWGLNFSGARSSPRPPDPTSCLPIGAGTRTIDVRIFLLGAKPGIAERRASGSTASPAAKWWSARTVRR